MALNNNVKARTRKAKAQAEKNKGRQPYVSGMEYKTLDEKQRILDQLGKPELIDLFRDWKPQIDQRKRRTEPPLDQRVAISITDEEKDQIEREIRKVRKTGDKANVSSFIRNRATSSVDVVEWRQKAEDLLASIDETTRNEKKLKRKRLQLNKRFEDLPDNADAEDKYYYEKQIREITDQLESLSVAHKHRSSRLSGRMTTPEAETIKWRANRLALSVSDFLRFCIFNHSPGSEGDSHLSVEARKRFYIGILDVAANGWGDPPVINQCKNCAYYRDEAEKFKQRVRQLEQFQPDV